MGVRAAFNWKISCVLLPVFTDASALHSHKIIESRISLVCTSIRFFYVSIYIYIRFAVASIARILWSVDHAT